MHDRVWIWFADNGQIRKWDHKPFPEGAEYVPSAGLQLLLVETQEKLIAANATIIRLNEETLARLNREAEDAATLVEVRRQLLG